MIDIEKIVSPLIEEQFPEFYQENGASFIDFVKQYYVWMESQNQALNASRSLLVYLDIDKTTFSNTLGQNILVACLLMRQLTLSF
jgi:hypothetical protein